MEPPGSTDSVAPRLEKFAPLRAVTALAAVAALVLLLALLASLRHLGAPFARPDAIESAAGLAIMVGGVLAFRWFLRRPLPTTDGPFLLACAAAFLASRVAAISLIPSLPVSDFASYVRLGEFFAAGGPLPAESADPLFFPWGFPALLASVRRLQGNAAPVAPIVALTCGVLSLPLLYDVARRALGREAARGACVLYVMWPAQLLLTPVVASEHPATLFALLALSAAVRGSGAGGHYGAAMLVFAASVGAAGLMRPVLGLLAPIAGAYVALVRRSVVRAAAVFGLGAAGYFAAQAGFAMWCEKSVGRAPPNVAWWNLLAGLNHDAGGQWNEADAERYFSHPTPAEREAWARAEALRRLGEPIGRHAGLALRKLALLWGDEYYGAWWATRSVATNTRGDAVSRHSRWLFIASQWFHMPLLALALAGAARFGWVREPDGRAALGVSAALPLLLLAGGTLVHLAFESQSRYAHVFTPGVLMLAAVGAAPRRRGPETGGNWPSADAPI